MVRKVTSLGSVHKPAGAALEVSAEAVSAAAEAVSVAALEELVGVL